MRETLEALLSGSRDVATFCGGCEVATGSEPGPAFPGVVFPGAFNPLHAGHVRMSQLASRLLAGTVTFEISVVNVEKPPLHADDILARMSQFSATDLVLVTRAATFVDKARLFPGVTFLVGSDTALRIADARFYADAASRDSALAELAERRCRFLVFGRQAGGRFLTLEELQLPPPLRALCEGLDEATFRMDVASRELRGRDR